MPPRKVRDYPVRGKAHTKDGVKYYTMLDDRVTLRYDDPKAKAERKARKGEKKTGHEKYLDRIKEKVARQKDPVVSSEGFLDLERENFLYDQWEAEKAKKKAKKRADKADQAARELEAAKYYLPKPPVGPVSSSADAPPPAPSPAAAPKASLRVPDLDAWEKQKGFMRDVINKAHDRYLARPKSPAIKRPKSPAMAPKPAKKHKFPTFHQAPPPLVEVKAAAAPKPTDDEKSFLSDIVSKRGKNMPNQEDDRFPRQNIKFTSEKQRSIQKSQHERRKRQVLGGVDAPVTLSFGTQKSRLKKSIHDYKPKLAAKKAKFEAAKKRRHLTTEEFEAKYANDLKAARYRKRY